MRKHEQAWDVSRACVETLEGRTLMAADTVLLRVSAETSPARAEEIKQEIEMRIERRFAPVHHHVDVGSA